MEYKISIASDGASYVDSTSGETIIYDGPDKLFQFTSTDATQAAKGDQEWIGIALTLDEEISTNITWNGTAFTEDDVINEIANAESLGYTDDNTLIFWTYYAALPRTITLGTADGTKNDVSIIFTK